ncbi:glycoside hydrolase superfamily [Lasiosphaeria hispida]|uniref:Glycoside hydrolase superfamily n=1 Tax=Lasiosphaeria hispida TaxID=260671 RepID=A0AAJ0HDB1_9PEZI|nr:glycoside hydrolase superfamily [Lasiosphaeria hispida]
MKLSIAIAALATLGSAAPNTYSQPEEPIGKRAAWPNTPHISSGRYVRDATGTNITYAGTNWPGAADVMIPEGLQYQSIATIVGKVKSLGMNTIRLTYAIQMIDEIYSNGGKDITLQKAFAQALGQANGTKVLNQVLAKNPGFTASTTRLEVFDAVATECAKQEIYILLDNHISKGMWCCSENDGNSWWGDTYFNTANWTRGLAYMADHGKKWTALTSMSLRNEPREPKGNGGNNARATYNWQGWYTFVKQGAEAIHTKNADVLIFLSGLSYDTYLTPVVQGTALTPGTGKFSVADFPGYANKLVLELHTYDTSASNCNNMQNNLYKNGFQALTTSAANTFPVMLTEFGFQMDASTWKGMYASCLATYLPAQKAGWMIWVLSGSYYIRSGIQDYDEGWGLLNHDWSAWRSPSYVNGALLAMVKNTLS